MIDKSEASHNSARAKMKRHWMPLKIGDILAKTPHLSLEEFGAYIYLRAQYWIAGSLPNDDERVRRISRMTEKQWRDSRDTLAGLFEPGWRDTELEAEIRNAEEAHQRLSEAGQRGGQARARRFATEQGKRSQALSQATSPDIARLEASPQPGHKPGSSTSQSHPFGSPGRLDRVLSSQDCGGLPDEAALAPVAAWGELNPFGPDDEDERSATGPTLRRVV